MELDRQGRLMDVTQQAEFLVCQALAGFAVGLCVVGSSEADQHRDERGRVIESLAEGSGTREIIYQLLRPVAQCGSERVMEGHAQGQFLSPALGRVGQPFEQVQSFLTVVNQCAVRTAPQRDLSRPAVVLHRPAIVPPFGKMHREFRGNLRRPLPVADLFPFTELLVEAYAPCRPQLLVQHLLIQGVPKPVPHRHRPLRPLRSPCAPDTPLVFAPPTTPLPPPPPPPPTSPRPPTRRDPPPRHTCHSHQQLLLLAQPLDLPGNQLLERLGY